MKNLQDNEVLTVGVFKGVFFEAVDKIMDGFSALDSKIDAVDRASEERDRALSEKIDKIALDSEQRDTALGERMERIALDSEHRDRALSSQIQHLAFTKADWNDIV